jgi:hypothetical protein
MFSLAYSLFVLVLSVSGTRTRRYRIEYEYGYHFIEYEYERRPTNPAFDALELGLMLIYLTPFRYA